MSRRRYKTGDSLAPLFITFGLLVVIAIGLTAWLYYGGSFRTSPEAGGVVIDLNTQYAEDNERNAEIARRVVGAGGIFDLGVDRFQMGMNRYPANLDEMQQEPPHLKRGERWSGPYINNPDLLIDPWGNPYQYRVPGVHNLEGYDFWSNGADGVAETADDVGNW